MHARRTKMVASGLLYQRMADLHDSGDVLHTCKEGSNLQYLLNRCGALTGLGAAVQQVPGGGPDRAGCWRERDAGRAGAQAHQEGEADRRRRIHWPPQQAGRTISRRQALPLTAVAVSCRCLSCRLIEDAECGCIMITGAASFEELISKTRERAAQKAAAAQQPAAPSQEPQQPSQAAAPAAQPEQCAQPRGAPGSLQPPSAGEAMPAANGGSSGRLADSSGRGQQEQEEGGGEDMRRFSGRPVDGNVVIEAGPADAVQGKGAAQGRPACAGQQITPTPGSSRSAGDAEATPGRGGIVEKARNNAVPMHAADAVAMELRSDDLSEEVLDSDLEL